jgi:uroporphyrinogen-III decarboxylase
VWLCGAEAAVMMAVAEPELFEQVVGLVGEFDRMRTDLMLEVGGVDLVVQRGWYSSTDFWSPALFEQHVLPNLTQNVQRVHDAGAKFGYVMTTGVKPLLGSLVEAGVDLFYWADPVMGDADLATIREKLGGKMAIAGGVNAPLTLGTKSPNEIRRAVREAVETLGAAGFILEPVDSLFPDTPWEAVKTMIDAWKDMVAESEIHR